MAQTYAQRLRALQQAQLTERAAKAESLADELHTKVVAYLEGLGAGVRDQFRAADAQAQWSVFGVKPPDEKAKCWHKQLIRTAREVDFFTNLSKRQLVGSPAPGRVRANAPVRRGHSTRRPG